MGKIKMINNRDTGLFISIAERPGNLGATLFNYSFEKLGMNATYLPLKLLSKDLPIAIAAIKAFHVKGCGVSMPHKSKVMKYLDRIDSQARKIGAVNTIVIKDNKLIGYNTDWEGAKRALTLLYKPKGKEVLIVGAGGAARAIIIALKSLQPKRISISNRDNKRSQQLAKEFGVSFVSWNNRNETKAQLVINATPVGMNNEEAMVIEPYLLNTVEAVMDVVVSPKPTLLIRKAMEKKKICIAGVDMATYQAEAQFELYTGKKAPHRIVKEAMKKFLTKK
ncbi:MAG: shikimate dehydrogenase [bacterium]|nr:shikimate dehydrogenase [bacterium]